MKSVKREARRPAARRYHKGVWMRMVICPKCGAAVREGKAFCFNCGAPMDVARAETKEPAPEFRETVTAPPQARAARTPATQTRAPLDAAPPATNARVESSNPAPVVAPARHSFISRRAWIVILLLLALLVLCFVVLVVITD
jgi:uncharacterized Zn finger protein (UPF0148 family)